MKLKLLNFPFEKTKLQFFLQNFMIQGFPSMATSIRSFFFIPAILALLTFLFILSCMYSTFHLSNQHQNEDEDPISFTYQKSTLVELPPSSITVQFHNVSNPNTNNIFVGSPKKKVERSESQRPPRVEKYGSQRSPKVQKESSYGNNINNKEVFHDREIFLKDYKQMNKSFKIYVYPHTRNNPFANLLDPVSYEPGGNYASESYFQKVIFKSHFITKDPEKADLFYLPFSIARLRHDPRISVHGIPDFIKSYVFNVSRKYPYWNRTGGADHFYVACHSIGRSAMDKAPEVKVNAIQVVCSSSYFLTGYVAHKDVSLPQIWPRKNNPANLASSKRKKLAFFAGSINSRVREGLLQVWRNDSEIHVHHGRLATPYADALLGSKFCLHVKGFEVNTARVGDSLYYGCVPVIIADHYDLPFADILNWKSFSVVIPSLDIPLLKNILKGIGSDEYSTLQRNVLKVRKHFQWRLLPIDYDVFYMVMYELWLRRSSIRVQLSYSPNQNR